MPRPKKQPCTPGVPYEPISSPSTDTALSSSPPQVRHFLTPFSCLFLVVTATVSSDSAADTFNMWSVLLAAYVRTTGPAPGEDSVRFWERGVSYSVLVRLADELFYLFLGQPYSKKYANSGPFGQKSPAATTISQTTTLLQPNCPHGQRPDFQFAILLAARASNTPSRVIHTLDTQSSSALLYQLIVFLFAALVVLRLFSLV
ncbi:hypothetical protein IFR05_014414 [Cadophora sp. M221]|nr:hypothetical protein IFR05_014414 [Cadophora sp. M221]